MAMRDENKVLVIYDFDETLTVYNMTAFLQLWKMGEKKVLNLLFPNLLGFNEVTVEAMLANKELVTRIFGGQHRVTRLRAFFQQNERDHTATQVIRTDGILSEVMAALRTLDLLRYFRGIDAFENDDAELLYEAKSRVYYDLREAKITWVQERKYGFRRGLWINFMYLNRRREAAIIPMPNLTHIIYVDDNIKNVAELDDLRAAFEGKLLVLTIMTKGMGSAAMRTIREYLVRVDSDSNAGWLCEFCQEATTLVSLERGTFICSTECLDKLS